jgi:hemoglobin
VRPSLYEFAGGEPAFLALATAHHARCLQDPELNHPFSRPGQHPQHVQRLAAAFRSYMEWAVTEVLSYPDRDSVVPPGLPMPQWSWNGLRSNS